MFIRSESNAKDVLFVSRHGSEPERRAKRMGLGRGNDGRSSFSLTVSRKSGLVRGSWRGGAENVASAMPLTNRIEVCQSTTREEKALSMKFRVTRTLGAGALALLAGGLAGCTAFLPQSGWGPTPPEAPPLVQNCGIVTISSPTRYACNGKVYTTFDLEKKRLAWETAQNTEATPANIPVRH
jgi:hypothetical protein